MQVTLRATIIKGLAKDLVTTSATTRLISRILQQAFILSSLNLNQETVIKELREVLNLLTLLLNQNNHYCYLHMLIQ
jgi:hypothetical protein